MPFVIAALTLLASLMAAEANAETDTELKLLELAGSAVFNSPDPARVIADLRG